jgi:hypothetical protein
MKEPYPLGAVAMIVIGLWACWYAGSEAWSIPAVGLVWLAVCIHHKCVAGTYKGYYSDHASAPPRDHYWYGFKAKQKSEKGGE